MRLVRIIKLSNQIKKRFIFLIIIFFCFSFSIFLISYSLKDQIAYFVSPEDIRKMNNIDDRYLKVGGLVKEGSLKFDDNQWNFEITDESKYVIKVVYTKSLPSLIEENKGIIVEGRMGKDNLFIAEIVLAKHDENYMPQSAIDKLKEEGVWRGN
ncbi:MAG: cytochrome c biogenesis protein CcmE [alpha proteobacterium HIMB59]|nr:MAG: cytochrome c biogenesis protein CcmE [alpha proteobacterium HIMB59]